jgi:DivIVA domain-containing protein
MTADDARTAEFPRTPWGRRGYDETAVAEFAGRVARELAMCANEATGLREEVARLRRRFVTSQRGEAGEWLADAAEAHAMAVAIVSEAQQAADRYVTDAQAYAGRLTGDARERREEILAEAERVLADARAQARDAALAALDEPAPAETPGALQAARAGAAWQGKFGQVSRRHALAAIQLAAHILQDWEDHEAADRPPAPGEIAIARKEPS